MAPILGSSTKAGITQVLAESKPLTLKELHLEIKKVSSKPITYQAIHKATKEMLDDEILEKHENTITINKQWIEQISQLGMALKAKKEEPKTKETPGTKVYTFGAFVDLGKFIIQITLDTPNPKMKGGVAIFRHAWPFVGMNKNDFEKLKQIGKNPFYDIIINDSPLDHMFGKILSDVGKHVIVGSKIDLPFDVLVKGDTAFQVYFTKEFTDSYSKIFDKYKKLEMFSVGELMEKMLIQKTKIIVVQITDEDTADKLREIVLKEYNRKSN